LKFFEKYHFHIKLLRHFEFSRKKFFHKSFIFTQNIKKIKEKCTKISFMKILGEKYNHFRRHRHREYRRNLEFLGMATVLEQCKYYNITKNLKISFRGSTTKKS
jgi:hypothetical protein